MAGPSLCLAQARLLQAVKQYDRMRCIPHTSRDREGVLLITLSLLFSIPRYRTFGWRAAWPNEVIPPFGVRVSRRQPGRQSPLVRGPPPPEPLPHPPTRQAPSPGRFAGSEDLPDSSVFWHRHQKRGSRPRPTPDGLRRSAFILTLCEHARLQASACDTQPCVPPPGKFLWH